MTTAITIDAARSMGRLPKFWRSTGFTPAELLLLPEMRLTLDHLAALPNRGVEFLRVHYLLNLVRGTRTPTGYAYDWALLDEALDTMVSRGLRPFFEIMGNPSGLFSDFEDMEQIRRWRDLTSELAGRCIARYGADEVRAWYFESWNEPDLPWWPWGTQGYLNYYDACVEGLGAVDPALRIGGPGTARPLSDMFKAFVAHCDTGTNCLTGATGVRLDFVSVHEKGAKKHEEDLTPHTLGIIEREMSAVRHLREHHPRLARLPFVNNECDPQVGWIVPHTWHAHPYFAAMIVKIVDQHQRLMVDEEGVDYDILSNDNGFIGRWGHRTMLTYFGSRPIKAAQAEHVTDLDAIPVMREEHQAFDLVKKSALTVFEFLSLLGEERLAVSATPALAPDVDGLGVMAARRGRTVTVLLYDSVDRIWRSGERRAEVVVSGLPDGPHDVTVLAIDDERGTAYWTWERLDAPGAPTAAELAEMRARENVGIVTTFRTTVVDGRVALPVDVPLPSVAFLVIEPVDVDAVDVAQPVIVKHIGLNGTDDVVITWACHAPDRVVAYEVLYARNEGSEARVVSGGPLLSHLFLHADRPGPGRYTVRARSLGGTALGESTTVAG